MTRRVGLVLCLWYLLTVSVHAQSLTRPLATYAGAAALDLHSTVAFLRAGYREGNPVLRGLDHNPPAFVATSAALDATACYVVYRVWGRHHRKTARLVLYAIASVRVALAVDNYRHAARPVSPP